MCLYFLPQLGSGHRMRAGEHGASGVGVLRARALFLSGGLSSNSGGLLRRRPSFLAGLQGTANRRPFPLRSFPWTGAARADASASPRALFGRPPLGRPPLASKSLVGDSQNRGGAQSCLVQSSRVPTYVFPRHVTFTTSTPPSVSCQTMPSRVTLVPGSQGPRQSGSVMVPTDVHSTPLSFRSTLVLAATTFAGLPGHSTFVARLVASAAAAAAAAASSCVGKAAEAAGMLLPSSGGDEGTPFAAICSMGVGGTAQVVRGAWDDGGTEGAGGGDRGGGGGGREAPREHWSRGGEAPFSMRFFL